MLQTCVRLTNMTTRSVSTSLLLPIFLAAAVGAAPVSSHANNGSYHVGVGDVLKVVAFQHDEISGEFEVDENGLITYPLLDQVRVAGLTVPQIASRLKQALEKDYYVSIQLQVSISKYRSQPVTIIGEVASPGTYYLQGKTTLTELIAKAGGLKPTAGQMLELRRAGGTEGGEKEQSVSVSVRDLVSGAAKAIVLHGGDVISVAARQLYFITGEVARPGRYELQDNQTLMQAISQAGGLGKFASQEVEMHREVNGKKKVLIFNLTRIRRGKVLDPKVEANDVLIVKRRFF